MVIKRNVIFELENRKLNGELISENVPIRLRVVYSGKRIELSTGFRIDRDKWDDKKRKVKNNSFNKAKQSASDINAKLSEYDSELQKIFKKFELEDWIPERDEVKRLFHNAFSQDNRQINEKNFFDYVDLYGSEYGKQSNWSLNMYSKLSTLKNHLQTLNPRASFGYFDENGLSQFVDYLQNVCKLRNNSIITLVTLFKSFLRWTKKKGYNRISDFETFKPKLKSTQKKIIFLTQSELEKLKSYQIPQNSSHLERARDVFLFLCYSGLRYSDVSNLKKTDIKKDYFEITTMKTNDSLRIEFNKHTKTIIKKYEKVPYPNNNALPIVSNPRMIRCIRQLAELAGIDELIRITYYKGAERIDEVIPKYKLLGTHSGRRTFVCTALSLGISANVVMKWTGHSDYKSMRPYIDIADEIKANAMKKFDLL